MPPLSHRAAAIKRAIEQNPSVMCVCQTFECDYVSRSQLMVDQQHYAGVEYTPSSVLLQRTGNVALRMCHFDGILPVVYCPSLLLATLLF